MTAMGAWAIGDRVHVIRGENGNGSVRTDVPAVIVGCRGPIVVVQRVNSGRFDREGLWAWSSDLRAMDATPDDGGE